MSDKPPLSDIVPNDVLKTSKHHDLRTRIANAIVGVDDWRGVTDPAILADAVIVDLGLRQETTYAWNKGRTIPTGIRYATPWRTDESL